MSKALETYRALDVRLTWVRLIHFGKASEEERRVLDDMDAAWQALSDAEQAMLSAEPAPTEDVASLLAQAVLRDNKVNVNERIPARHLVAA